MVQLQVCRTALYPPKKKSPGSIPDIFPRPVHNDPPVNAPHTRIRPNPDIGMDGATVTPSDLYTPMKVTGDPWGGRSSVLTQARVGVWRGGSYRLYQSASLLPGHYAEPVRRGTAGGQSFLGAAALARKLHSLLQHSYTDADHRTRVPESKHDTHVPLPHGSPSFVGLFLQHHTVSHIDTA